MLHATEFTCWSSKWIVAGDCKREQEWQQRRQRWTNTTTTRTTTKHHSVAITNSSSCKDSCSANKLLSWRTFFDLSRSICFCRLIADYPVGTVQAQTRHAFLFFFLLLFVFCLTSITTKLNVYIELSCAGVYWACTLPTLTVVAPWKEFLIMYEPPVSQYRRGIFIEDTNISWKQFFEDLVTASKSKRFYLERVHQDLQLSQVFIILFFSRHLSKNLTSLLICTRFTRRWCFVYGIPFMKLRV